MKFEDFEKNVINWGIDRGIVGNSSVQAQVIKTIEELGELAGNVAKGNPIDDDLGDILVTLVLVARLSGTSMQTGWELAWDEIKDRKGFLSPEGIFVKEEPSEEEQMRSVAEDLLNGAVEFK